MAHNERIGVGYTSDLVAKELAEARHEPLGLLYLGRMPAVVYEVERSFRKTRNRLPCLRVGEYPIARSPHDEGRHLQMREPIHQHLALSPKSDLRANGG